MCSINDLGLIGTISDDEASAPHLDESESDDEQKRATKKNKAKNKKNSFFDGFTHDDSLMEGLEEQERVNGFINGQLKKSAASFSLLDDKIAEVRKRKQKQKQGNKIEEESDEELADNDEQMEEESSSEETTAAQDTVKVKLKTKKAKKKGSTVNTQDEPKMAYAEEILAGDTVRSFQDLDLRRPLQRALTALGYNQPTPIQAATIPQALKGRDICACSATGTGKTAAFMIPTLERLLYRDTRSLVTRVLVLAPTRELAIQIFEESRKLAQFTDIRIAISTGGLDVKAQEAALRQSPDVVIATPGRLIDHLRNAPCFNLSDVEVLILDEADRMLDEFFLEQMKEVMRLCSRTRQTMLFSATMTENVKDLATVSLTNPVKIFVNENKEIAFNLQQEFVRIRPHMEGDREAIVAALVKRTFRNQCIIFIQTKKEAHRMHLVLGLLGVKVGELHGNLSQAQRLDALKNFKDGVIDVLIATDLAARGLDIEGVKTVINLTMPSNIERYIHRVGRTARAGKSGRSISLSGEKERSLLHEICKRSTKAGRSVLCRTVPQKVIEKYKDRIQSLEPDIEEIEKQEKEEKELRSTENQLNRIQNRLENKEEANRPKRTWFQTKQERLQEMAAQKLTKLSDKGSKGKNAKSGAGKKKANTPLDRVEYEMQKAAAFGARAAKREMKGKRVRAFDDDDDKKQQKKKKKKNVVAKAKTSFDRELTRTSKKAIKAFRSGGTQEKRYKGKTQSKRNSSGKGKGNRRQKR